MSYRYSRNYGGALKCGPGLRKRAAYCVKEKCVRANYSGLTEWRDFFENYREMHPNMPFKQAQKQASMEWKGKGRMPRGRPIIPRLNLPARVEKPNIYEAADWASFLQLYRELHPEQSKNDSLRTARRTWENLKLAQTTKAVDHIFDEIMEETRERANNPISYPELTKAATAINWQKFLSIFRGLHPNLTHQEAQTEGSYVWDKLKKARSARAVDDILEEMVEEAEVIPPQPPKRRPPPLLFSFPRGPASASEPRLPPPPLLPEDIARPLPILPPQIKLTGQDWKLFLNEFRRQHPNLSNQSSRRQASQIWLEQKEFEEANKRAHIREEPLHEYEIGGPRHHTAEYYFDEDTSEEEELHRLDEERRLAEIAANIEAMEWP